jgi:hypothetical protein
MQAPTPAHRTMVVEDQQGMLCLTADEKQEAELEFATNLADFNSVKALFNNLKDGGNTQGFENRGRNRLAIGYVGTKSRIIGQIASFIQGSAYGSCRQNRCAARKHFV